jgi:hypothetical protein
MAAFMRNNGLALAIFGFFLLFLSAESAAGYRSYNEDRKDHHWPKVSYGTYIGSGSFLESVMENWESEFLEMAAYVVLTAFLFQKGSPESKSESDARSESSAPHITRHSPWPARRGGLALKIYRRSLSLAFCILFLLALMLHAYAGWRAFNEQQLMHGGPQVALTDFIGSSHFWYQSFQNWQSEFLGLGTMVLLSIWLRQEGSPQSKPVEAPHEQTGR